MRKLNPKFIFSIPQWLFLPSLFITIPHIRTIPNFLLFLLICLFSSCEKDQAIPYNEFLTTEAEVDAFSHAQVGGDLSISGEFIRDLTPLENIRHIGGSLFIGDNDMLKSLAGLENLETIDSGLHIYDNFTLTDINGLSGLEQVGNLISIDSNKQLLSLSGLENLEHFCGDFSISGNPLLTNLNGLNITSPFSLYIRFNNKLMDVRLPAHITVLNTLDISYNDSITTIQGLENLQEIKENLTIVNNPGIETLNGLENLEEISGNLWIEENDTLRNFHGLSNLKSIGGYFIVKNNNNLKNFEGLNQLTSIQGYFAIENNKKLKNFLGLNSLELIGGSLIIQNNPALESLQGLEFLTSITNQIFIGGTTDFLAPNPELTNFCPVSELILNKEDDKVSIFNNGYNPSKEELRNGNCKKQKKLKPKTM
jgi:hypothetical protein